MRSQLLLLIAMCMNFITRCQNYEHGKNTGKEKHHWLLAGIEGTDGERTPRGAGGGGWVGRKVTGCSKARLWRWLQNHLIHYNSFDPETSEG